MEAPFVRTTLGRGRRHVVVTAQEQAVGAAAAAVSLEDEGDRVAHHRFDDGVARISGAQFKRKYFGLSFNFDSVTCVCCLCF